MFFSTQKQLSLLLFFLCMSAPAAQQIISSHKNVDNFNQINFYYNAVEALPVTSNEIIFGTAHADEDLEKSFSSFQGLENTKQSNSPAICKFIELIKTQREKFERSLLLLCEQSYSVKINQTDESFVIKVALVKQSTSKIAAITIYSYEKNAPKYLINFLQSCFIKKTIWQKHWGKLTLGIIGIGTFSYLKQAKISRLIRKLRRNPAQPPLANNQPLAHEEPLPAQPPLANNQPHIAHQPLAHAEPPRAQLQLLEDMLAISLGNGWRYTYSHNNKYILSNFNLTAAQLTQLTPYTTEDHLWFFKLNTTLDPWKLEIKIYSLQEAKIVFSIENINGAHDLKYSTVHGINSRGISFSRSIYFTL